MAETKRAVEVDTSAAGTDSVLRHWDDVRERSPVGWAPPLNAWLITSHRHAMAAFRHPALGTGVYSETRPSPLRIPSSFELSEWDNRRVQRIVASCIGRSVLPVEKLVAGCRAALATVPVNEPLDVATDIAEHVARALVLHWFGLDESAFERLMALFTLAGRHPDERRRQVASRMAVDELLRGIERRRRSPSADLLGLLAEAWGRHDADDRWLVAFVAPMFHSLVRGIGGTLITHTMNHLSADHDVQNLIRAEGWAPARAAAWEAARLDPVNQAAPRRAQESLELAEQQIAANDKIWIVLPAVCRDPAQHPAPEAFRLNRKNRHLAFGHGVHVCIGRELALAVAAAAITELLYERRLAVSPAPGRRPRFRFEFGRTCVSLPVVLRRPA